MSSNPPPPYKTYSEDDSEDDPSRPCFKFEDPRYVYYRVYAPDGLLHCENGPTPFIGRIKATSVPPPHTVASLKRALVQAEKLPDPSGDLTALFKTRDTRKPMGKGARVDILTGELGATPRTPVALVFLRDPEEALCVSDTDEAPWNDELPIVYYRLYNRGGEEHSECAFDRREPALATINRDSIAPPRNALCVKRRIAKLEGKPIYKLADLFINTTTDDPRSSTDVVDDTQGSSRDKPLLVVLPERRPGLYNQPVLIVKLPSKPGSRYGTNTARWLSPAPGDTLLTDGVAHCLVNLSMPDVEQVYTAVDKSKNTGWISANSAHSKLVYEPEESSGCSIQ